MKKIIIISLVFGLVFIFNITVYADCRGCCSWHGGVVCRGGITMCFDGTSLSSKCRAKDCNKCGGIPKYFKQKSVVRKTSQNISQGIYVVPFDDEGIEECVCDGILIITNRGCPCKQRDKK